MSNVIVLLTDEHNPMYSEPYGSRIVKTPNMQRMADEGVVFENAYCPSPLCLPSRSAFLTGRRVHELQAYSNCNLNVDPSYLSFGASLSQQGIYSAYIGKVHAYAMGKDLGFNEMISPGDVKIPGDTKHRRNPMIIRTGAAMRAFGYGSREDAGLGDRQCVDEAVRWLRKPPGQDKGWVLVVNVRCPHFPHYAEPQFWDIYKNINDMPKHGIECESAQHHHAGLLRKHFETENFTKEQIIGLRRGYFASISFVDSLLGRLLDTLEETGLCDTTNIIYSSDHGEMLGKFGMWWKCSLYEDSVRIPMIASGPDFATSRCVTTPVDLHDLQATLFDASNTRQPENWCGTPLSQIPINDDKRVVFSEYHGHGAHGSSYMIRKGKWKYIYYIDAPNQLFNLETDPDELVNLAESEGSIVATLLRHLHEVCSPEQEDSKTEIFIEKQLQDIKNIRKEKMKTRNAEIKSKDGVFRLWAFGDCHVGSDKRSGRDSLSDVLCQSEKNTGFDWDIAVDVGDMSGGQKVPQDEEGEEIVKQFSVLKKHKREQIYNLSGNHDRSGLDEPSAWWWQKWLDPMGLNTEFSKVDNSRRPYSVAGTWERYSFQVGNILFLMMSDINAPHQTIGRGDLGGNPAGVVSRETFNWWKSMVEANQDKIIISAHHYMLKETTVASGEWEGMRKDENGEWTSHYHGLKPQGAPQGASYLYFVDEKEDAQEFEKYLEKHPGAIALWLGGHTHTEPDDTYGGKSHVETKWGTHFINVSAITKFHGGWSPMSRLLSFQENSNQIRVQCYLHTDDFAPTGWYNQNERTLELTKNFQWSK